MSSSPPSVPMTGWRSGCSARESEAQVIERAFDPPSMRKRYLRGATLRYGQVFELTVMMFPANSAPEWMIHRIVANGREVELTVWSNMRLGVQALSREIGNSMRKVGHTINFLDMPSPTIQADEVRPRRSLRK